MLQTRRLLKRIITAAIHGFALCFLLVPPAAQALTQLDHATVTVALANQPAALAPQEVKLPYSWNRAQGGADGQARFVIRFQATPGASPQALFIRSIGNSFELAVNGEQLASAGVHGDLYSDTSRLPRLISIPPRLLRADNTIDITIGAVSGRHAGIGLVYVGTETEMRQLYKEAFRWRNTAYFVLLVISVILSVLVFLLWMLQREKMYLYYWLSEFFWMFRLADIQIEPAPLPWPWWGILVYAAYAAAPAFVCKFCLTMIGKHSGWRKRLFDIHLWLSVPVMTLSLLGRLPILVSIWLGFTILLCVMVALMVIWQGLRTHAMEQRVLAISAAVTCAAAIHDMFVFRIFNNYGGFPLLGMAWTAFGVSMAWIIVDRLHKSTRAVAQMSRDLALRLAQREDELNAIFKTQASNERHQAIIEERQRIMRDMHDGLGSQLVSAVQLVKDPQVSRNLLAEQLQDALDNIKLTVDAMQDTEGDIAMLLGALRYRLSPRLDAIGVSLSWDVALLPAIPNWTIQKSRHLQLILFEAISNIITHAKASRAHFSAQHRRGENGEEIHISLEDNGIGFQANTSPERSGKGIANMRSRANSIGAALQIVSSSEGTSLTLSVPVVEQAIA